METARPAINATLAAMELVMYAETDYGSKQGA
jgi:hypothetical protein